LRREPLAIVHVFRAPLGGLFRHVVDLATEQVARGHKVGMFFDSGGRDERVEKALAAIPGGLALGVDTCPISRMPGPGDIRAFFRFSRYLRAAAPDVIHGHGSKGGALARASHGIAGRDGPIRAYTPHGGSFNYQPGSLASRMFMAAEYLAARRTDLFLFESDDVRRRYASRVGVNAGIQRVVLNGLRSGEFAPIVPDADAADLVYVGELRAAKGIDTLLEALARIASERGTAPSTVFFGSGPDREALIQRAAALGIGDRASFPGPAPIRKALARGRVFVVPSRAESMPYVVLEGAAARVPMITTRVGGIPEIFGPYVDRLGPSDDPADLARRIASMLDMPTEAREARAAELARHVEANFSLSGMIDSVLGLYEEAIRARHRPVARVAPARP
jgi:glycosyltransferase involved in cell wall biosynthesis